MTWLILAASLFLRDPCWAGVGVDSDGFQFVVVQPGDTLWAIANKYLKDPARWDEIMRHNRLPTKDPTVALPGMTLRVPGNLIKAELRAAYLVYAVNRVLYRRKETASWKTSKLAMELYQGDTVRTFEASKARVKLVDNEILSLEQNSMAVIKPQGHSGDLYLKSGAVFAGHARVVTASASIVPRTRDTRYSASIEPDMTTRVDVFHGAAGVTAQGSTVDVPAGMATRVRPGLAPERVRPIENAPAMEIRAHEYAEALKVGGGAVATTTFRGGLGGAPSADLEQTASADADKLRGELESLRVGLPVAGFRVQAAVDREFRQIIFDKNYEAEDRLRPNEEGIKPGAYWWRMAIIDLLGTEGRFSDPRYYTVGIRRGATAVTTDLKSAVLITGPDNDAVISADTVRVTGVLRDDRLRIEIQGKPVRLDADGNFLVVVPISRGVNEILLTVFDPRGNSTQFTRRVTRR